MAQILLKIQRWGDFNVHTREGIVSATENVRDNVDIYYNVHTHNLQLAAMPMLEECVWN